LARRKQPACGARGEAGFSPALLQREDRSRTIGSDNQLQAAARDGTPSSKLRSQVGLRLRIGAGGAGFARIFSNRTILLVRSGCRIAGARSSQRFSSRFERRSVILRSNLASTVVSSSRKALEP